MQGVHLVEDPQRSSLFRSARSLGPADHLHLSPEVVAERACENPDTVADSSAHRDVVRLRMGLQLAEDAFLRAAAVAERQDVLHAHQLVGDDDLQLVAILIGDEQFERHGTFVLLLDLLAHRHEAINSSLRMPTSSERRG